MTYGRDFDTLVKAFNNANRSLLQTNNSAELETLRMEFEMCKNDPKHGKEAQKYIKKIDDMLN